MLAANSMMSPGKEEKGLALWESVVSQCDTVEKAHQQITQTLLDIDQLLANSGSAAMDLRAALQEYKSSIKSFSKTVVIWDGFFKTFQQPSRPSSSCSNNLLMDDDDVINGNFEEGGPNNLNDDVKKQKAILREKAAEYLSQTPLIAKSAMDAFQKLQDIKGSAVQASSNILNKIGQTPSSALKSQIGTSNRKDLHKMIFKSKERGREGEEGTPESVNSSTFIGSPPVTIAFAKPSALGNRFHSAIFPMASNASPGMTSISSFLPTTPSSLKDAKRRLTEIGIFGTPQSEISSNSSFLARTPAALASAAGCGAETGEGHYIMDDLSLSILSSEDKKRKREAYFCDPSTQQSPSLSIASLDLATTGNFMDEDLDLTRFPPVFQTGEGAKGLVRIYEAFSHGDNETVFESDHQRSSLTLPSLMERLNLDRNERPLDQDRCFLLLDLLVRKRYLKMSKSAEGETIWLK